MEKQSLNALAILSIFFAVTSAFIVKNGSSVKKFTTAYALYSVCQDMVSVWGSPTSLAAYSGSLRVDITGVSYLNNDIGPYEEITEWIASNPTFPEGKSQVSYYCDQSDADDVCLVKVIKVNDVDTAVLEYIAGDVDTSLF